MPNKIDADKILIIDFGSQVTQLIARRIRESGVYCEIHPFNTITITSLKNFKPLGIILSGGPGSVHKAKMPKAPASLFELDIPILGICYGQQTLVSQLGGEVTPSDKREFGRATLSIIRDCPLFEGVWKIGKHYPVWMSHGDRVEQLPRNFIVTATTEHSPYAVITNEKKKFYGVQFHPEVVHTQNGSEILRNFTHKICGCSGDWTMSKFKSDIIAKIRHQVGNERVICGLSGGVDSSVVAILLHKALGNQVTCIFVDNGLMRHNEAQEVTSLFKKNYDIPLIHVDATDQFLNALTNISDPEEKRKTIGKIFIDIFEAQAQKIGDVQFLAQGTLYPDVIESISFAGGPSATIKSHHNVGGLPARMKIALVEPLRELFKDEVRSLGQELGLPQTFIERHPFPGPGLAIRIPGIITRAKLNILRQADAIYLEELKKADLYASIWQAFAVLLPTKAVGVMGDARTYEYVCSLRAVTSTDGMTADFYPFDHKILGQITNRIINEVKGINRVVYDITSKPPGTIEWE